MSRRHPEIRKKQTRVTIPERVGPHVKLVFFEMKRLNLTYDELEDISGVKRPAMKAWRHRNYPSLESIEAVLGALGWDFVPIPRAKILPPEVIAELRPAAERLGMSMEDAIRALIEIVAGIHSEYEAAQTPASEAA